TQMARDLLSLWSALTNDPGETRAVILTGAGERAFCAGADLKERQGMSDADWQAQHVLFERQYWALLDVPVPVIAAVNGHAYAGGLEMMLACDFAYAVPTARFALTEVTLGIMPGAGGTQFLPRAIGERRAKEAILTGRPITAENALAWGLVNRLFAKERLMDEAFGAAAAIADNAPIAVRQAKRSIHTGLQLDLRSALLFEIEAYNRLVPTEDRREGITAFNEKRKARFTGR
ncbi:MAG TPA: enoyl-CoA hydratase-related protein, partial [Stellaceae bacterium]|nr:enoyl-CoA hydratase-related protein [Stellaceae bacterium]